MSTFRKRILLDRLQAYKSPKMALIDLAFCFIALFTNPYRTCRKKNIIYGETPYATYQRLATQCSLTSQDTWMELGSGRGKGCFFLAHHIKCKVIGIEWIGHFVFYANLIKVLFRMPHLTFSRMSMDQADIKQATVIYLYGTELKQEIPPGVKIISISEPLPNIPILKSFWIRYPWGRTTAYLQSKQ